MFYPQSTGDFFQTLIIILTGKHHWKVNLPSVPRLIMGFRP